MIRFYIFKFSGNEFSRSHFLLIPKVDSKSIAEKKKKKTSDEVEQGSKEIIT